MRSSTSILVLAGPALDVAELERCVHAAGHQVADIAHSVAELRARLAERGPAPEQRGPGIVLLIDAAVAHDPGAAGAVAELVRVAGLPVVQLAPASASAPDTDEPAPAPGSDAPAVACDEPAPAQPEPVICALAPRELALAVDLAVTRHELARAGRERESRQNELGQLYRALARRSAELQAVNDELEALGFSISHDLRAPLRAIDGLSKIILDRLDDRLDPRIQAYLRHIVDAAQRMARLIGDLLALSRLMRREMHIQTCDLSAMAREILDELQRSAPERAAEVVVAPGIEARADPSLLRVLLENLLGNAWKFTARRAVAVIQVGVTSREGQRAYFVRDNGVGFDMANAEKLFGAFQRMHSAHEFEGTGIGLAKVQRIVRRHGGDIWAEAAVGRGATFTFMLS